MAKAQKSKKVRGLFEDFTFPGPVAQGYAQSSSPVAVIIGPVGGAKTTTSAEKMMIETCRQHPSINDGVRRALIVAVRHTYIRMHDTLTPSLKKFFGSDMTWSGDSKGAYDGFIQWEEGGQRHELTLLMRCFQDQGIESFIKGFEPTSFYLNEFDEQVQGVLDLAIQRCGRYALHEKPEGVAPAKWCKIFGDCNMPDFDNWVHEDILANPSDDTEVFIQPSGLSPEAENLHVLERIEPGYYQNLERRYLQQGRADLVERFIKNRAGYTAQGVRVYGEFDASRHLAEGGLEPERNRQLLLGVDQGGQAAAVIAQASRLGAVCVFEEVVLEPGVFMGGEDFGRHLGATLNAPRFRHFVRRGGIMIRLDPAAMQRHSGTKEDDERTWYLDFLDGFMAETGLRDADLNIDIAPTNAISTRQGAVKALLKTANHEGNPNFKVDKRCKRLVRGFLGGYRRQKVQGTNRYGKTPVKDHFSDIHDALQYAALEVKPLAAGAARDQGGEDAQAMAALHAADSIHEEPKDPQTEILM